MLSKGFAKFQRSGTTCHVQSLKPWFYQRGVQSQRNYNVLCFSGDGVGPELMNSTKEVMNAAIDSNPTKIELNYIDMPFGYGLYQSKGYAMNDEHIDAFKETQLILKGPVTIPPGDTSYYIKIGDKQYTSPNQALRKIFQLYANVRPAKSCDIKGFDSIKQFNNLDIVVVRENTEDLYSGEEYFFLNDDLNCANPIDIKDNKDNKYSVKDLSQACAIKRITRKASMRIAKFCYTYAKENNRHKVTALHKANVNKYSDGLFLECHKNVFDSNSDNIEYNDQLADSLLYKLMLNHSEFDILSCPNLYGDLVSDLLGGMIGSLGLMPAAHIHFDENGESSNNYALFEPTHGSAPDIAGLDAVNPISQWRSAIMMFEYLKQPQIANTIENGIQHLLKNGIVTKDLGGKCTTSQMTAQLVKYLTTNS